jgi:aminopeptidase N
MSNKPKTIYLKDYTAPAFLIPEILLNFDLEEEQTWVNSVMHLKRNTLSKDVTKEIRLDGENLELHEVKINGETLDPSFYDHDIHSLTIKNCSDDFFLETKVRLKPQDNKAFSGLYKTKTVFCTQMEAQGFRRTTFFMDRPDVLSKYTAIIRANKKKYPILLSNGNLTEEKDLDGARHQATWQDPFPKPCYLFALVAGDLDWIADKYKTKSQKQVELKIFVDKGKKERALFAMEALKQSMKWDEDTYNLEYDLDLYNIVAVDDFNMGAMENKGLNIFNSKYVLASTDTATDDEYQAIQRVIGHEYFHNWTGNRVTCRDWFQLSLKEGLTVFRDQEFSSDLNSRPVKRIEDVAALRSRQFPEDSGPMAHPVRPSSYIAIDNFYTVTVYEKGAEVIRMLETLLGQETFRKGVTKYFELFDGQAVTTDDWVHAMELVSGRNLNQFKLWYEQIGTPQITVETKYDATKKTFTIQLSQLTIDPLSKKENKAYLIPLKVGLVSESGQALAIEDNSSIKNNVIELKEKSQTIVLTGVNENPILSINREFSAPIQLNFSQSDEHLYTLMTFDADSFNRWESAQKIYRQTLLGFYNNLNQGKDCQISQRLVDSFAQLIKNEQDDPALLARLLELPQAQYLGQFLNNINPANLSKAYEIFYSEIAKNLNPLLLEKYQNLNAKKLGHSAKEAAQRAFKNNLLSYLYKDDNAKGAALFYAQFKAAENMTDTLAALSRLAYKAGPEFELAMHEFYLKWKDDSLVMNKWLMVSAMSKSEQGFEKLKEKTKSDVYDAKNPNNVFALLYYFAQYNWTNFHRTDGLTYDWMADQIIDIDGRNPQVSSRLGSCFNNWKKFSEDYRQPMEKALKKILNSSPSNNLYEIVERAMMNT